MIIFDRDRLGGGGAGEFAQHALEKIGRHVGHRLLIEDHAAKTLELGEPLVAVPRHRQMALKHQRRRWAEFARGVAQQQIITGVMRNRHRASSIIIWRRRCRASRTLDLTVPRGMPRICAISAWDSLNKTTCGSPSPALPAVGRSPHAPPSRPASRSAALRRGIGVGLVDVRLRRRRDIREVRLRRSMPQLRAMVKIQVDTPALAGSKLSARRQRLSIVLLNQIFAFHIGETLPHEEGFQTRRVEAEQRAKACMSLFSATRRISAASSSGGDMASRSPAATI